MRAIEVSEAGGPEQLQVVEVAEPEPGPGQVVVAPAAIGLNFIETYQRSGVYPVEHPFRPGGEGAGEVVAVAADVTALRVGDQVAWTSSVTGSYAERVLLEAAQALPIPAGLDLRTAAALPLQGLTVSMLVDGAFDLRPGQDVLLTAGAGGIGLLLTQVAAHRGARVITTVSTAEKEALSREAGAADVIRYDGFDDITTELPATVRDLTGGAGVHVVYDGVGKSTFDGSLASLRTRGTLVLFGGASGPVPPFDPQRLNRAGSVFLTRPTMFHYVSDPDERARRWSQVSAWVTEGVVDLRVGATFPLADAEHAHRALEGRQTTGKVLLLP
ncbi:quinone oxidoreductase family protein [Pseudactinotalea suaedae]|uniref:quinone oxidoreductase family protein n=1 Tax=Pseudactinotalea suaedae TaxID=1524924 RepID=UPI0012E0E2FB|nr:quinone oxidoreductase [Pseudactinotalea suaedae]